MGHIYLSHSHPIAIYACPISSHPMGHFPWDSHRNDIPMDKPVNTTPTKSIQIQSMFRKKSDFVETA